MSLVAKAKGNKSSAHKIQSKEKKNEERWKLLVDKFMVISHVKPSHRKMSLITVLITLFENLQVLSKISAFGSLWKFAYLDSVNSEWTHAQVILIVQK